MIFRMALGLKRGSVVVSKETGEAITVDFVEVVRGDDRREQVRISGTRANGGKGWWTHGEVNKAPPACSYCRHEKGMHNGGLGARSVISC